MKIGLRILLGYFLIVGLAAWFVLNVFVEEVKPGVRETLEDTLVDTAQLLADLATDDMKSGTLQNSAFAARMQAYAQRSVDVTISGVVKESLDYRVYITNDRGIVMFDSEGKDTGNDYSRWNDVYLTLRGQYGARSTRDDPNDDASSVMHVAAPIKDGDRIIGVLTVAKPIATVQPFVERSQRKILRRSGVLLAGSLLIGLAFAFWLTHSLRKLQRYVASVEAGEKAILPRLGNDEIGALGRALDAMRNKLEGKEYVENLMHTLAHELKSPIAAIQGSAELLKEDMPETERRHFLANILSQNQRQKQLIDKLLALVKVEKQQQLTSVAEIGLHELLDQVRSDFASKLAGKSLQLEITAKDAALRGDVLLLRQALGNLLDNAIDFAPPGSIVTISTDKTNDAIGITLQDRGTGIPDYAAGRIFDRFYSLPRPDGAKSTGLGLPFVKEVAFLHGGTVSVNNQHGGGVCARLQLPLF
ncbi:MAG: two-component system sensor histidine kinase CreC [Burkholderiales bacterium RIFCSPLOWO2_02_FULL_57_36]|nr:MAG: two-component system sensor histidine kinase CreC [Burkholderiales bacterium RIFCSPLOWO2_02_FULL_57_36]